MRAAGVLREGLVPSIVTLLFFVSYEDRRAPDHAGGAILFALLAAAVFGVTRSFSRRERLIGALRASERKTARIRDLLYTTLASIGDAVIATDTNGIVTFLNPEAQRLTGWADELALGQPLDTVFRNRREDTGEPLESPAAAALRLGIAAAAHGAELVSRSGHAAPIDVSAAPIRDRSGSVAGVVLVFRDTTERRKAELEQMHLASIVESSEDAIIGRRLDGAITSWNEAATRMFGYSAGEMIGTSTAVLLPPGKSEDAATFLDPIRRGERVVHFETVRRRKDGQEIVVDLTVSPIRNAAGAIVGASKIARDITGRKRSEAAMLRMQEQLLYSQKLESLSALAGGVAHDFNNLLMGITVNASLMLDGAPPDSTVTDLAGNILIATEQAADLTKQMLAYSGRGKFAIEPLSLSPLVRTLLSLIQGSIPKGVEVRLELAGDLPSIQADAGQIQQLTANLILNAAEAIEGEGRVTVATFREEVAGTGYKNSAGAPLAPGSYAVLRVEDTGCGMDETVRARMFDPFFTTKFTGRGLGLAAALGIVRGHKGGISVWSEPGRGTAFHVLFPLAREAEPAAAAEASTTISGSLRALHAKIQACGRSVRS